MADHRRTSYIAAFLHASNFCYMTSCNMYAWDMGSISDSPLKVELEPAACMLLRYPQQRAGGDNGSVWRGGNNFPYCIDDSCQPRTLFDIGYRTVLLVPVRRICTLYRASAEQVQAYRMGMVWICKGEAVEGSYQSGHHSVGTVLRCSRSHTALVCVTASRVIIVLYEGVGFPMLRSSILHDCMLTP